MLKAVMPRRRALALTAALGLAVGAAAATVANRMLDGDRVPTIDGTARVVAVTNAGEVVAFDKGSRVTRVPGADLPSYTYSVKDVQWQDGDGTWRNGTPDCLQEGKDVRVGVIHTESTEDAPGQSLIAYIRCTA